MSRWYFNAPCQRLSFRHVKVYNTANYKVVHNFDYAASILSLGLAVSCFLVLSFFKYSSTANTITEEFIKFSFGDFKVANTS